MNNLITEMQHKGLIEIQKQPCNIPELIRQLCDADLRHNLKCGQDIPIQMFATLPEQCDFLKGYKERN